MEPSTEIHLDLWIYLSPVDFFVTVFRLQSLPRWEAVIFITNKQLNTYYQRSIPSRMMEKTCKEKHHTYIWWTNGILRRNELNQFYGQLMPHHRCFAVGALRHLFHFHGAHMAADTDPCRSDHAFQQPTYIFTHLRMNAHVLFHILQFNLL